MHGKTRRWSLPGGRYPTMGVAEAREVARAYYTTARKGEDPAEQRRARDARAVTLRKAIEHHVERMLTRNDQPRSVHDMRGDAERYFDRVTGGAD